MARLVHEPTAASTVAGPAVNEGIAQALRRFGALFLLPHTAGIVLLGCVSYASFITLRGL